MEELFKGRTVIIIAHRLQTVKKADSIVVLEAGKIIEEGTHKSLIEQAGTYARMLEMQSGFY
jgi:ATP-binding cassette subfamily B protein